LAGVYDDIDVRLGWNGDLALGEDHDVETTTDDTLQSLLDQIHSICASMFGDWVIYPNRAAGLDDFIGEANTRSLGRRMHDRLVMTLVSAGLVTEGDLQVRVVPIHPHKVLIVVRVHVVPTSFNQLRPGDILQTALVVDAT
jgi:hypothetical protein